MGYLVWLGILVGILSCASDPYATKRSEQSNVSAGDAKKGVDGDAKKGEEWPFKHKDGNVEWRLSPDKITIGRVFSVRVDVDVANKGNVGLTFKLVECGDLFVASEIYAVGRVALSIPTEKDHIRGMGVQGTPGRAKSLIIIDGDGTSNNLPPYGACKLQVDNIFYPEGPKISSAIKLQLQANPLALGDINLDDFRSRLITATVKTSSDFFKSFSAAKGKQIVHFKVCPHAGDHPCIGSEDIPYSSDILQYEDGDDINALAVNSLKFGYDDGKKYPDLPDLSDGKYWIMATFYEDEPGVEEHQYVHSVVVSSIKLTSTSQ